MTSEGLIFLLEVRVMITDGHNKSFPLIMNDTKNTRVLIVHQTYELNTKLHFILFVSMAACFCLHLRIYQCRIIYQSMLRRIISTTPTEFHACNNNVNSTQSSLEDSCQNRKGVKLFYVKEGYLMQV
uniref:Uncharacterized protein n=1 Tax=Glossina austeni TaxID=7395 RepID=A0A1A9VHC1_GLOAU